MTADAGLLARLHDEIEHADTPTAVRAAGEHIFRDYFAGLLSEPEADQLRGELAAHPTPTLAVVLSPGDLVETALQLAGHGEPAVPGEGSQ